MHLISELSQIVSEYSDPETYTILKSLNLSVINHTKYENLLSTTLENSDELIEIENKYNQLFAYIEYGLGQRFITKGFMDYLDDITNQIKKFTIPKIDQTLEYLRILGYINYEISPKIEYTILTITIIKDVNNWNIEPNSEITIILEENKIKLLYNFRLLSQDNLSPLWKKLIKYLKLYNI